jgi:hypothetical protein
VTVIRPHLCSGSGFLRVTNLAKVVNNDADVVHPQDRHVHKGQDSNSFWINSASSQLAIRSRFWQGAERYACISMGHVETDEDVVENARLGDLPVSW